MQTPKDQKEFPEIAPSEYKMVDGDTPATGIKDHPIRVKKEQVYTITLQEAVTMLHSIDAQVFSREKAIKDVEKEIAELKERRGDWEKQIEELKSAFPELNEAEEMPSPFAGTDEDGNLILKDPEGGEDEGSVSSE